MNSTTKPRLEMRDIRKSFGATVALDGVDLSVEAGEVLALVGENGAGKSTLMKMLSGALRPDSGKMLLEGKPFAPRNPHEARLAGVAMVYQELSLASHLSVAENIMLGVEPKKLGFVRRMEVERLAHEALSQLGHSDIRLQARVGRLSIAERQLVEIARALAIGCRVLLLDEPTSSLAAADVERLFALIRRLKGQGHAIIYISHFLEEVKEISNRFVVLRDGQKVGEGSTSSLETNKVIALMVGREVKELYPRSQHSPGEAVLEVSDLSGISKPVSASLNLHRGEVLGIGGLMGSGRTELLRTIFGLDDIRSGRIKLAVYAGPSSPTHCWIQGMGMVSEDRKNEGLAMSLSVSDNMTLSRMNGFGPFGIVMAERQDRAAGVWIERMRIKCRSPRQPVSTLSGGNQQKVAVARLLHHDVDVLLLDEPTRGIDVGSKAEIYRLIDELAVQGKAILIVSSYLPELFGMCDRVTVMYRGHLSAAHPVEEIDEHDAMMEATGASWPTG